MSLFMMGPPRTLLPHVMDFCARVAPGQKPLFVNVTPGVDDIISECTNNVDAHVKKEGGAMVLGWQIWEWYGLMIEAEFHALWIQSNGELRDVTPKAFGFDKILFLPDPTLVYQGVQINNKREPLVESAHQKTAVVDFIQKMDEKFAFLNAGDRATQYGPIQLSELENMVYRQLESRAKVLSDFLATAIPEPTDFCRCGFGKKFGDCHGIYFESE